VKPKSKRPYLLRALFDWIVDSDLTPYLLVAAGDPSVIVPQNYVTDGRIVLNVSPAAVRDLEFGDDAVRFNGRFAGTPFAVAVPLAFVLAIYATATGEGMMFDPAEVSEQTAGSGESGAPQSAGSGSHLKVIK